MDLGYGDHLLELGSLKAVRKITVDYSFIESMLVFQCWVGIVVESFSPASYVLCLGLYLQPLPQVRFGLGLVCVCLKNTLVTAVFHKSIVVALGHHA